MTCRTINGKPTLTGDYEHDIEQCRCRIDADTARLRECREALTRGMRTPYYEQRVKLLARIDARLEE